MKFVANSVGFVNFDRLKKLEITASLVLGRGGAPPSILYLKTGLISRTPFLFFIYLIYYNINNLFTIGKLESNKINTSEINFLKGYLVKYFCCSNQTFKEFDQAKSSEGSLGTSYKDISTKYEEFKSTSDETRKKDLLKILIEQMCKVRGKVGEGLRQRLERLNFKEVCIKELNINNIKDESIKYPK